jgi:hypothetical protein
MWNQPRYPSQRKYRMYIQWSISHPEKLTSYQFQQNGWTAGHCLKQNKSDIE